MILPMRIPRDRHQTISLLAITGTARHLCIPRKHIEHDRAPRPRVRNASPPSRPQTRVLRDHACFVSEKSAFSEGKTRILRLTTA